MNTIFFHLAKVISKLSSLCKYHIYDMRDVFHFIKWSLYMYYVLGLNFE